MTSAQPAAASSSSQRPTNSLLSFFTPEIRSYFIAGGVAGATSRTVVSPLERLKIIQQIQPRNSSTQYKGVWRSLVRMWKEEGFRGYMRGNGINCLRIVPYSAVQFTAYEQLKKFFTRHGSELDTPKRLASGALAGITSVTVTYPLDLVRSRLSIATASLSQPIPPPSTTAAPAKATLTSAYHTSAPNLNLSATKGSLYTPAELTMWGMTLKVVKEEGGVRGLYRGLVTTAMGVAPYVGINFAAYELLRGIVTPPEVNDYMVLRKLSCGAMAGACSQTLTYPFDVLRRKMQVTGMASGVLGRKYNGALEALGAIVRQEGIAGLYRGLWPNLLKVAPSIATSFFTYELVKEIALDGFK